MREHVTNLILLSFALCTFVFTAGALAQDPRQPVVETFGPNGDYIVPIELPKKPEKKPQFYEAYSENDTKENQPQFYEAYSDKEEPEQPYKPDKMIAVSGEPEVEEVGWFSSLLCSFFGWYCPETVVVEEENDDDWLKPPCSGPNEYSTEQECTLFCEEICHKDKGFPESACWHCIPKVELCSEPQFPFLFEECEENCLEGTCVGEDGCYQCLGCDSDLGYTEKHECESECGESDSVCTLKNDECYYCTAKEE